MQQIMIIGFVGQPATTQAYAGQVATNFTLAVNEKFNQPDGSKGERSTWYNCTIWSKGTPTKIAGYITKGAKLFIQGKPSIRNYTDKNGLQRYSLDIVVARVELLDSKKEDENSPSTPTTNPLPQDTSSFIPPVNDELPL